MRKYSVFFTSLLLITVFAFTSCKKDDGNTDDTQYMTGTLAYTLPGFLTASQEIELSASGITEPESGLVYKWTTTGFSADSIIGQNVTITTPAAHGDYQIILIVSHPDYASKTLTKNTIVINPVNPESFSGVIDGPGSFTDVRDGKIYKYKKIDKLDWFTSNLKWRGAGKPYNNEAALTDIYGVLYTWNEATGGVSSSGLGNGPRGVCPQGWSIPTRQDWENLGSAINGSPVNFDGDWKGLGQKLSANALLNGIGVWKFSPNNLKENILGWNALPGGSSSNNFKSYSNINQFGFWWSSSERDSKNGEYRLVHFDMADFPYNFADKGFFGASVRCVRIAQ
jgi:uncharacterized protein (TIGR02145 family)